MLTELRVANLGIVEEITIALAPGLTAITGETGAGKTLLVEAMELLLGSRADSDLVRDGAAEATVEGRFVDASSGEEHVLARVLPRDGRSRAYVDGRLVTAGELAAVGERLVDLHGQHAHQQLLGAAAQRGALDRFVGPAASGALTTVRTARAEARARRRELEGLGGDARARAREVDLLRFQIAEIDDAGLDDPAEDDRLAEEEARLDDAVALRAALVAAHHAIEAEGLDALGAAAALLRDRPVDDLGARVRAVQAEAAELARDLRLAADAVVEDPERLAAVRARRQSLRQLCRKYGESLGDVVAYRDATAARLAQLEHHEEHASRLGAEVAELEDRARAAAEVLRAERRAAAPALAAAVTAHLRDLAMARAVFEVAVEPAELTDDGADAVSFLLAANPGETARPLARAASGGELARTMLALRLVATDGPPTLVFDEVDAGIGGEAGTAVGRLLGVLGRTHQVLCVTHLAQVAAHADHQVVVEKVERAGRTVATARPVEGADRIRELSRMLAGVGESDHARRHAAELLAAARPVVARAGRR